MQELRALALLVVCAPLIGAVVTGLFCRYLSRTICHWLTCTLVAVSFIASCYMLNGFVIGKFTVWNQIIYVWANTGNLTLSVGFLLDKLSVLMITVVSFISLMVHIYTIGYMRNDPGYQRFFSYISLFTFGMLMLVMANNFMQLFFGWEAVGVMSYLLIGFWYKKPSAIFANLKAFIINRIGDFGFLLGIAAILKFTGSLQYTEVFTAIPGLANNQFAIDLICISLFIGAMAKSAQVPLHVWLPDSMEGPTPISALIHAATMVTAGVYMVARMSPIFEYSELALSLVMTIGAITCLFMGILAVVQRDIKRIIAYSTLSQLGYMVVALGVSAYSASIFHLITHAFFKALLFLAAGSCILAVHHEQDIFKMGNLRKYMPITFVTMLLATLALIGFPGTSGFYSKDLIIESVAASTLPGADFAYSAVLLGVFFTAVYSFRLLLVVFFGREQMTTEVRAHLHESPAVIYWPLVILAIPSILIGAIMAESMVNGWLDEAIYVLPQHQAHLHIISIVHGFFSAPFMMLALGATTAWLCYSRYPQFPAYLQTKTTVLNQVLQLKYGFDLLNEQLIMPAVKSLANFCWNVGDILCIDGILINGTAKTIDRCANRLREIQTGYLYHYVFAMIIGLCMLVVWLLILR